MNDLIQKYVNGKSLSLFNNEIVGVSAIKWPKYSLKNKKVLSFEYKNIKVIENYMDIEYKFFDEL